MKIIMSLAILGSLWLSACGPVSSNELTSTRVSRLRVGAFNIQSFGDAKMQRPHVADRLARILKRYDLVLIQEVRDADGSALHDLLDLVNAASSYEYRMRMGRPLGRTSHMERYAYFYRPERLTIAEQWQVSDRNDDFEREPLAIKVRAGSLTFAVAGIHVKPQDVVDELNSLDETADRVADRFETERVLIMGDLNADCRYLSERDFRELDLVQDARWRWSISRDADTTVHSTRCAYDHILDRGLEDELTSARVFDFESYLGISKTSALRISDHYPVEAILQVNF